MALQVKTGSFALPTTTNASFPVTGVGFKPKAVIFSIVPETADINDVNVSSSLAFGVGISSSSRASVGRSQSAATVATRQDNTRIIALISGSTLIYDIDLVSLDNDGFTINVAGAVGATAYIVNYTALGGNDLKNAALIELTSPAGTGNQATTGVGFKPDAIMVFSGGLTTTGSTDTTHARMGIGFGTSALQRGTSSTVDISRYENTSNILTLISTGSTKSVEADLISTDSDGFTLNFTTVTSGVRIWALCLQGGQYSVGSDTQKTSTGTKANTTTGFIPTGLLVTSVGNTAGAAIDTANGIILFGGASGTTARGYNWIGEQTASVQSRALNRASIIASFVPSNTTLTATSVADLSSFDSSGFTLNWTTADATAREFIFLTMGNLAQKIINRGIKPHPFSPGLAR